VVRRAAFTLIELIFAIVIISITALSIPMMNSTISNTVKANILQEAIFAASTQLSEALSATWDENSTDPTAPSSYSRVIDHSGNCNALTRLMPGHIAGQPKHRRCVQSAIIAPAYANTGGLESMRHTNQPIFINNVASLSGYKDDYNSTLIVDHNVSFDSVANNPDLKRITVTIFDHTGATVTSLKAYSANIGEVDYYSEPY